MGTRRLGEVTDDSCFRGGAGIWTQASMEHLLLFITTLCLLEFLEAVSIKAPEVMIRGKRNQRQDAEKPVEETIYLT